MLELVRQHDLALRKLVLLLQANRFARQGGLQFGGQRIMRLVPMPVAPEWAPKGNRKAGFGCSIAHDSPSVLFAVMGRETAKPRKIAPAGRCWG